MTPLPVVIELRRVRLDLRRPLVAGHATIARREVVLVQVRTAGGVTGWGESAALERATYSSETTEGVWAMLRDELAPASLAGRPDGIAGHPMAHAALADACLDARLRASGTGLAASLGASRTEVASVRVLGMAASLDALLAAVEAAPAGVKLKIGPGWDLEPLRAVRDAFPHRWLAADANGGYDLDDIDGLAAVDDLDLAYLEQPLAGLTAAAEASKRLGTPIVLDEPIGAVDTVRAALALGGLGGVNVKPGKSGGIEATARVLALVAEEGLPAFVGGMLETGVGRAGALGLAALDACTLPTDLGPSDWYFDRDITPPIVGGGAGSVVVPSGPGIGVEPDPARLDAATVDRVVLEA